MKLNYTDGCICTSLTVDGTETIDLDIDTFRNVIKKFLTFGRDKNFAVLLECIHKVIEETYYTELDEKEEEEFLDNMNNHYVCHINNNQYDYTEWWDKKATYDTVCINGNTWDNILTEEMYKDMCDLIDKIDDIAVLQSIFCSVLERCGKYDCSDKPCECCGDYIRHYAMEID